MKIDANELILKTINDLFGVEFLIDRRNGDGGSLFILRPKNMAIDEGFKINVQVGWKRLFIQFKPENKSGSLIFLMGNSKIMNKETSCAISSTVIAKHGESTIRINGKQVELASPYEWPLNWQDFRFEIKSPIFDIDGDLEQQVDLEIYIIEWLTLFLSILFPLLPLEEEPNNSEDNIEGLPEGASILQYVNRYERSKLNRQVCIAFYGPKCRICGFDFEESYGDIGKGYIEVHHKTPVSKLGEDYIVNPIKELIPVCSNCHSILHRRNPPYTVEEMKEIVRIN